LWIIAWRGFQTAIASEVRDDLDDLLEKTNSIVSNLQIINESRS
jgi:hypothetical protein